MTSFDFLSKIFLPRFRYNVQVASARDVEATKQIAADGKVFDPFKERRVETPTTWVQ